MNLDAELLAKLAIEKNKRNDIKGALIDINQAIQLDIQSLTYYKLRADYLSEDNQFESAQRDYSFVIENSTDSDEIKECYECRVDTYLIINKYAEALEDLNWLIDNGFSSLYYIDMRSACKRDLGLFEEAIEDYSKAIAVRKTNILLLERAKTYFKMGNIEAAHHDLTQMTDMDKSPVFYGLRYLLYVEMGDHEPADRDITYLVNLHPPSDFFRYSRARFYFDIGHYEDAINDFTLLFSLKKPVCSDARLYEWMSKCYFHLHQPDETLIEFNKSRALQNKELITDIDQYVKLLRL